MSATIAVAVFDPAQGKHLAQVDDALRELKQFGKSLPGSVVVTERRRSADHPSDAGVAYGHPPATPAPASLPAVKKKG
jgi:hypothetical protein